MRHDNGWYTKRVLLLLVGVNRSRASVGALLFYFCNILAGLYGITSPAATAAVWSICMS
jgi:hypothetical protein